LRGVEELRSAILKKEKTPKTTKEPLAIASMFTYAL
jgi:hypothetical protein